jgi:hypothetical protein
MKISKILFQTSKEKPKQYVIDLIKKNINNDWQYLHFDDSEIVSFFNDNPLPEFPNIIDKFNKMPTGAHKADLFRYYFIYLNGGVFVDSDAMIFANIEEITKDYDFFSVRGKGNEALFQGFIGASKNNKIIYDALVDVYNIDIEILSKKENYLLLCKNIGKIVNNNNYGYDCKLYYDKRINNDEFGVYNELDVLILIHYYRLKKIPFGL